jgi:hypothetical protein
VDSGFRNFKTTYRHVLGTLPAKTQKMSPLGHDTPTQLPSLLIGMKFSTGSTGLLDLALSPLMCGIHAHAIDRFRPTSETEEALTATYSIVKTADPHKTDAEMRKAPVYIYSKCRLGQCK